MPAYKSRRGSANIKQKLLGKRNSFKCYYCKKKVMRAKASLEHRIPVSGGGYTKQKNCVLSCRSCNTKKGRMSAGEFFEKLRADGII
jgi:5-methylcytosine-specific restriction endonuclease McrA